MHATRRHPGNVEFQNWGMGDFFPFSQPTQPTPFLSDDGRQPAAGHSVANSVRKKYKKSCALREHHFLICGGGPKACSHQQETKFTQCTRTIHTFAPERDWRRMKPAANFETMGKEARKKYSLTEADLRLSHTELPEVQESGLHRRENYFAAAVDR